MTHNFENMPLKQPKDPQVTCMLSKRLAMTASGYERGEVVVAALQLAYTASKPDQLNVLADCLEEMVSALRRGEMK